MTQEQISLQSLLDDEVTRAVLRADRLPVASFEATLEAAALRLPASGRPPVSRLRTLGRWSPRRPAFVSRQDPLCCGA